MSQNSDEIVGDPPGTSSNSSDETFLLGPIARKDLRNRLKSSTNPAATIVNFQRTHSLGACLTHAVRNSSTPNTDTEKSFHPEGVLTFLGHLGVSRFEAHSAFREALQSCLLDDISKGHASAKKKHALMQLLQATWKYVHIQQVQPILVQIIKSLGEDIPTPVLLELAKRKETQQDSDQDEMKYADLLQQLSLDTKRIIWETEWTQYFPTDETELTPSDKMDQTLLARTVQPMIRQYWNDSKLQQEADLLFVPGIREKRVDTLARRCIQPKVVGVGEPKSESIHDTSKTQVLLKKRLPEKDVATTSTCASAVMALKDTIGTRPILIGAVFQMLMTEHGLHDIHGTDQSLVGGSSYLTCTLLSDLIISYAGQLPKQYETIAVLADTLDTCVKEGIFTDQALVQVQSCLRTLYSPNATCTTVESPVGSGLQTPPTAKHIKISLTSLSSNPVDETPTDRKWIRSIIMDAIQRMKDCDPTHLFLQPVTDHIAPNYSTRIQKPICIRDMETKTATLQYSSLHDFETDVSLMFQNCITYNVGNEGKWVREEAKRQQVIWEEETQKRMRSRWEKGRNQRNTHETKSSRTSNSIGGHKEDEESKKRKRDVLLAQQAWAKERSGVVGGKDRDPKHPSGVEVHPLAAFSGQKRIMDSDLPSMHALASMLLSDPFVVRLLLDRTLRLIKVDVMNEKTTPACHSILPSIVQLLHLVSQSTKLCACKGKYLYIPNVGFESDEKVSGDKNVDGIYHVSSHTLLRRHLPLLTKLWLQVGIDKRMTPDGDLANVTAPFYDPTIQMEEWVDVKPHGDIICTLVQGIMIDVLHPGSSNDKALLVQIPRLNKVMLQLSWDPIHGRPFYTALISAIMKHKSRMSHILRDLIVSTWLGWFHPGCMHSPVHEYFMKLLNEWSLLGNILLPRDKMLQFAQQAVNIAQAKDNLSFHDCWGKSEANFNRIKVQYERMLHSIPLDKVEKWKLSLNVST